MGCQSTKVTNTINVPDYLKDQDVLKQSSGSGVKMRVDGSAKLNPWYSHRDVGSPHSDALSPSAHSKKGSASGAAQGPNITFMNLSEVHTPAKSKKDSLSAEQQSLRHIRSKFSGRFDLLKSVRNVETKERCSNVGVVDQDPLSSPTSRQAPADHSHAPQGLARLGPWRSISVRRVQAAKFNANQGPASGSPESKSKRKRSENLPSIKQSPTLVGNFLTDSPVSKSYRIMLADKMAFAHPESVVVIRSSGKIMAADPSLFQRSNSMVRRQGQRAATSAQTGNISARQRVVWLQRPGARDTDKGFRPLRIDVTKA